MERKRKSRAKAAGYRRRSKKQEKGIFGRLLFWLLLAVLGGLLICDRKGELPALREKVEAVFTEYLDLGKTIETIGQSFSGRADGEDNVMLVFGRMILGLEEPVGEENTDEPIVHFIDDIPQEELPEEIAESAAPILDRAGLAEALSEAENDDSTVNEAFRIPSPDIVDDAAYVPAIALGMPLKSYRVTSRFGYRIHPISGNTTFHYGADLAAGTGTKVASVADGTVSETGYGSINGNYVKITHGDGYISHYAHLQTIDVKEGEKVSRGERVGTVGSTGYSTGPHLHFELRHNGKILDPFAYFSF